MGPLEGPKVRRENANKYRKFQKVGRVGAWCKSDFGEDRVLRLFSLPLSIPHGSTSGWL